jgi:DJ-1/PfpI family
MRRAQIVLSDEVQSLDVTGPLLPGRAATTNWLAKDELARLGARPCDERYVFDGKYVTAAGVSAGIDMALALVAKIAGGRGGEGRAACHRIRPAPAVQRRLARHSPRRAGRGPARRQPFRPRLTPNPPAAPKGRSRARSSAEEGSEQACV